MKVQVLGAVRLPVRDSQFREAVQQEEMSSRFYGSSGACLDCSSIQTGGYYDFIFDRAIDPSVYIPALELLSFSPIDEGPEI